MSSLNGWELLIYFFSIIAVSVLANLAGVNSQTYKSRFYLIKKVAWGIMIISSVYWVITFPYIGSYDFSSKSKYPSELNANKEAEYIKEHHQRIETLEEQVKEFRAVRERLDLMLQIIIFGIIFYGCNQIFNSKKNDLGEVESDKFLKL